MKKTIATIILLIGLALNVFAQQEIPMFFDNELMLQTDRRTIVAYSPDGSKIATVFGGGKIAIWDAATGREITRLAGHSDQSIRIIEGIMFSPNGRQLASCSWYGSAIKIWDTASGALLRSINQAGVSAVSFSPDGSRIAGAYSKDEIGTGVKIWNTANGSEVRTLAGHTDYIWSVRYSPDGRQLLTASSDRSIRIWDSGNGQTLRVINEEASFGDTIYSPNGQHIAARVYDRNSGISLAMHIFNTETGQKLITISGRVGNLAYSPDGIQLLVNAWDDNDNSLIKIFESATGRELRSFNNGDDIIGFSPDGRRILTTSRSFSLRLEVEGRRRIYGASYATLLDATTGRVTGTIGYGPLNVGARAYADMQIARFLGDTAAVSRQEAVLQFITGRGNATRAEIEAFYRNNVRALVSQVVDEEFRYPGDQVRRNNRTGINTVPSAFVNEVKQSISNFFLTPTTENLNRLRDLSRALALRVRFADAWIAWSLYRGVGDEARARAMRQEAEKYRVPMAAITRTLEADSNFLILDDSTDFWIDTGSAYVSVLRRLNQEIASRASVSWMEIP